MQTSCCSSVTSYLITIFFASTNSTTPVPSARMSARESSATRPSRPVPTIRRLRSHQRHSLTLHVRTHQGTVRIVVLKERNHRSGHRYDLVRSNVHILQIFRFNHREVTFKTSFDFFINELASVSSVASSLARYSLCLLLQQSGILQDPSLSLYRFQLCGKVFR